MKTVLKVLGILIGIILLAIGGLAAWVGLGDLPTYPVEEVAVPIPTDSLSLANGQKIVETMCAYCHRGDDGTLSGKLFSPESEGFGEIWSGNITHHPTAGLGRYKDGEIAYLLRTGVKRDGKLAGPFMFFPHLSDGDVGAIIAYLRSENPSVVANDAVRTTRYSFLAKALIKFGAFKPLPYEETPKSMPPASDQIAFGRYLTTARYECVSCHSASFETYNVMEPEKSPGYLGGGNQISDVDFKHVLSRNITPHPTLGIGNWTEEQFLLAVRSGIRPDGSPLSVAMPKFSLQSDEELKAIWAYLKTVPVVENDVSLAKAEK